MHAGEVGTSEDDGIMNMCAAEELAYGIAWVEKKRKRSSRTSGAEACAGVSAGQFNLARALDDQLQWGGLTWARRVRAVASALSHTQGN